MPAKIQDQVTPETLFANRRQWMKAAALTGSLPLTASAYRFLRPIDYGVEPQPDLPNLVDSQLSGADLRASGFLTSDAVSSPYHVTHLNNFYEFTTEQEKVWEVAKEFRPSDWSINIDGLVDRPKTFTLAEIESRFNVEQRIYRMRCVEGWSMVIPWAGFPLAALLDLARPTSAATFVAFETLKDRSQFPNQRLGELQWPYREGLRLDEAMHPLTMIATGLYGKRLPPQNGAPIRLVVPWKYGFKSIKSIVKISLIDAQPTTAWNQAAPHENGFYANVNPEVDHPRWSQSSERRVGELFRRPTLPFNGYGKQVEKLYRGMDLRANY